MLMVRRLRKQKGEGRRRARWIGRGLELLEGRALLSSAAFALTGDWGSGFGYVRTATVVAASGDGAL